MSLRFLKTNKTFHTVAGRTSTYSKEWYIKWKDTKGNLQSLRERKVFMWGLKDFYFVFGNGVWRRHWEEMSLILGALSLLFRRYSLLCRIRLSFVFYLLQSIAAFIFCNLQKSRTIRAIIRRVVHLLFYYIGKTQRHRSIWRWLSSKTTLVYLHLYF